MGRVGASNEWFRGYYHKRRREYIDLLGGKGIRCGAVNDLEFDHVDPHTKRFPIGKLLSVSKDEALLELNKCQLLCHSCHIEKGRENKDQVHIPRNKGIRSHGSTLYKYGCRCEICVGYNSQRNLRRRKGSCQSGYNGTVLKTVG
jgi:hypothetical protein